MKKLFLFISLFINMTFAQANLGVALAKLGIDTNYFDKSDYQTVLNDLTKQKGNSVLSNNPNGISSFGSSTFGTTNGTVYAILIDGNDIYIGGTFTSVAGNSLSYIAKWNGSTWSGLGSGMNSAVYCLEKMGGVIYAGGSFTTAGGVSANRIASFNGTSWSAMGAGANGTVYAMVADGTDLYLGGGFTSLNGSTYQGIGKWNGSSFSGFGIGSSATVYAVAVDASHNVYFGGAFSTINGISCPRIAKYDGSTFSSLTASGLSSTCYCILVDGSRVYAGGSFATGGGVACPGFAYYNGFNWVGLNTTSLSTVRTIAKSINDFYIGGTFTTINGAAISRLAKYDGSTYTQGPLPNTGVVFSLVMDRTHNRCLVGGSFSSLDGTSIVGFGDFTDTDNPLPVELAAFEAVKSGSDYSLKWKTATEIKNKGFYIEEKKSNSDWTSLSFVEGAGNSNSPKNYSYTLPVEKTGKYIYRLKMVDFDGEVSYSKEVEVDYSNSITGYNLSQNYPNPFNPSTTISFSTPNQERVSLAVYNTIGEKVATLVDEVIDAGSHTVNFNGANIPSGNYFYKLTTPSFSQTKKLVLMK